MFKVYVYVNCLFKLKTKPLLDGLDLGVSMYFRYTGHIN